MLRLQLTFWGQYCICTSVIGLYYKWNIWFRIFQDRYRAHTDLFSVRLWSVTTNIHVNESQIIRDHINYNGFYHHYLKSLFFGFCLVLLQFQKFEIIFILLLWQSCKVISFILQLPQFNLLRSMLDTLDRRNPRIYLRTWNTL